MTGWKSRAWRLSWIAGTLAGCAPLGPQFSQARVEGVQGVVLPGWPGAVERHVARACNTGQGPAGGALLNVVVDPFGYVRVAGPARPQDAGPFASGVAYVLLASNCGHFSAPETPVRALIRFYPNLPQGLGAAAAPVLP